MPGEGADGGILGGLGDGCLRWLLSRGFRGEDQELRKESSFRIPGDWRRELGGSRCKRRALMPRTCQGPENAGSAPADWLKGPAGFVCVWPEHL